VGIWASEDPTTTFCGGSGPPWDRRLWTCVIRSPVSFLLPLVWKRTFGYKWQAWVVLVTQPTVSEHWRKQRTTHTHGLASSLLHPPLNFWVTGRLLLPLPRLFVAAAVPVVCIICACVHNLFCWFTLIGCIFLRSFSWPDSRRQTIKSSALYICECLGEKAA